MLPLKKVLVKVRDQIAKPWEWAQANQHKLAEYYCKVKKQAQTVIEEVKRHDKRS